MAVGLPPPPVNDQPGSFTWMEWYRQLRNYVSTSGSVPWYIINFSGSNITDIAQRSHNQLQTLQGGTSGEMYHLTATQHARISNHCDVITTTSGIVLPTTPTLIKPVTTVSSGGITYDSATGEYTMVNGGTYSLNISLNDQLVTKLQAIANASIQHKQGLKDEKVRNVRISCSFKCSYC